MPERRGRDTAGILRALAGDAADSSGAPPSVLFLVGADPTSDFVDESLARRALDGAELVVAVTGHEGGINDWADVVLPVAVEHERAGTTTNIESRVSRLGQKLVPPGQAWTDWMIVSELAAELGADLGFSSNDDVWDEIERLAPSFRGVDRAALASAGGHDGIVVPRHGAPAARRRVLPIDPMATPGVESVERQGAAPWIGLAEPPQAEETARPRQIRVAGAPADGADAVTAPDPGAGLAEMASERSVPHVAPADSYSLRLLSMRRLYDAGAAVSHSPSLVPMVREVTVRANPYDLDRLGAHGGDAVNLRSARGELTLDCEPDPDVPRGVVAVDFNLPVPGGHAPNAAAALIDANDAVVDVRMESVR